MRSVEIPGIDQALAILAHEHHALRQRGGTDRGFGALVVDLGTDFVAGHQIL